MIDATNPGATYGASRTVTGFFDSREKADHVVERLTSEGFSRNDIKVVAGSGGEGSALKGGETQATEDTGFWESLKDFFFPQEDRQVYAEGLSRGGYLVTLTTSEETYTRALDVLDDEGVVDLNEREAEWRAQGWSGYDGADRSTSPAENRPAAADSNVVPLVEENLRVGKREVNEGRLRVRSYVVETPVSEQVNLREEHVNVERRPVDRTAGADEGLFQDRIIEVEQKAEELVASKEARVKEEVIINKKVGERTQTVSDTVRHTEVEVQDERGARKDRSGDR